MVGYTVRACVPARTRWILVLPCVAAVAFGLLATLSSADREEAFAVVAGVGIFSLVLPLLALVLGDAVLGAEVRAGTLGLTWMSPVPFWQIVLARWLGAWLVALPTVVPAGALAAVVAGVPGGAAPMALALAVGSAAYVAAFIAVGALTRRAAVWSIALVIIVERLLGTALAGIAQLSPMWQARAVYAELGTGGGRAGPQRHPRGLGRGRPAGPDRRGGAGAGLSAPRPPPPHGPGRLRSRPSPPSVPHRSGAATHAPEQHDGERDAHGQGGDVLGVLGAGEAGRRVGGVVGEVGHGEGQVGGQRQDDAVAVRPHRRAGEHHAGGQEARACVRGQVGVERRLGGDEPGVEPGEALEPVLRAKDRPDAGEQLRDGQGHQADPHPGGCSVLRCDVGDHAPPSPARPDP
jgi:hypothetical protein